MPTPAAADNGADLLDSVIGVPTHIDSTADESESTRPAAPSAAAAAAPAAPAAKEPSVDGSTTPPTDGSAGQALDFAVDEDQLGDTVDLSDRAGISPPSGR